MRRAIILFFMTIFLVTGCGSYKDANRTMFPVTTIVDIDEDNKPIVYMEVFRSRYSQLDANEIGVRNILTGRGDTIADAILDLNQSASYEIVATHNKALIFTDKAAQYGIDHFLNYFTREQEYLLRPYIMIYEGDPKELLNVNTGQEAYIGLYLEELLRNEFSEAISYPERLFEYMNLSTIGDKTDVLILLSIQKNDVTKVYVRKGAVMKEDKMVEVLPEDDLKTYNIFTEQHQVGFITIPHPEIKELYISLEVLKNNVKTNVVYDKDTNNVILFKKNISLKLSIAETQGKLEITNASTRHKIEESVKKKIIKDCEALYSKYKNQDIDIFNFEKIFMNTYPHDYYNNAFQNSKLELTVEVFIEGSPNTQNYNR